MPPCYWDRLLMEKKNIVFDRLIGRLETHCSRKSCKSSKRALFRISVRVCCLMIPLGSSSIFMVGWNKTSKFIFQSMQVGSGYLLDKLVQMTDMEMFVICSNMIYS